jgi:lipoic acid synthetase
MQPTANHLPIDRFVEPGKFDEFQRLGMEMGFRNVFSGPLVRSSYHADEQAALVGGV